MNFVRERFTEAEKILCPCQQCMNNQSLQQNEVERHLLLSGMSSTYTRWIDHGEDSKAVVEDANVDSSVPEHTNDCGLDGMLGKLIRSEQHGNEDRPEDGNENVASQFKQLIEDAKRELYPGCMNFSRFILTTITTTFFMSMHFCIKLSYKCAHVIMGLGIFCLFFWINVSDYFTMMDPNCVVLIKSSHNQV
jgi:hypothetical protein